jgi:GAF domain-containing protein
MGERPDTQVAMTQVTQGILQLIPKADACFVALVVRDELVEVCRAGSLDGPEIRLSISESLSGLSFLSGTAFRCDDSETNPLVDRATARRLGVASIVSVPLRNGIRALGALVAVAKDRAAFTEDDVETLASTAQSLENELAPTARRVRRFAS